MRYIDVRWHHADDEEPVRLISEIDGSGFETRKLEFYRDGRVGWAERCASHLGAELGIAPVPSLAEINIDPQFVGVELEAVAFEALWKQHTID